MTAKTEAGGRLGGMRGALTIQPERRPGNLLFTFLSELCNEVAIFVTF